MAMPQQNLTAGLRTYAKRAGSTLGDAVAFDVLPWSEAAERLRVVESALRKVNAPYQPRARGHAWDCATILADTYAEAGAIPEVPDESIPFYRRDFAQHSHRQYYLETLERWAKKVERTQGLPGDIALFDFGLSISHSAIVIVWPIAVHAWADTLKVRVDEINQAPLPARRLEGFWSPWALRGGA